MKITDNGGGVTLITARRRVLGHVVVNYTLSMYTETTTCGRGWTMLRGKPHVYTCLIDRETLGVVHDPWTSKPDLNVVVAGNEDSGRTT